MVFGMFLYFSFWEKLVLWKCKINIFINSDPDFISERKITRINKIFNLDLRLNLLAFCVFL